MTNLPENFVYIKFIARRTILLSFTTFFIFLVSAQSIAAKKERWYEVEVIAFATTDQSLQATEKWPEKPGQPKIGQVVEVFSPSEYLLNTPDDSSNYYVEPIEPGEDNLAYIANRIKKSDNYQLLAHRTWRQTATRKKRTIPVYVDDNASESHFQPTRLIEATADEANPASAEQQLLEALLAEESSLNNAVETNPFFIHELDPISPFEDAEIPASKPVDLSPIGPPNHNFFGLVKLFKNRFLHVSVDFLYRAEPYEADVQEMPITEVFPMAMNNEATTDETALISDTEVLKSEDVLVLAGQDKVPLVGFRQKKSKRIRLKEIHYFDHPMFGVVVRVIPYVEPEPDEPESDA